MMRTILALPFLLLTLAWPNTVSKAGEAPAIAVIMATGAPEQTIDKAMLARIFLGKMTLWDNHEPVRPVNLEASHPLRRLFSERALDLAPEDLESYWNDRYFQGIFPPYAVASEEAALRFVAESPNAIGYVSACSVDRRVKVLAYLTQAGLVHGGSPGRFCARAAGAER
jgi:ABC-type phosphate transport system substrate-binding protein